MGVQGRCIKWENGKMGAAKKGNTKRTGYEGKSCRFPLFYLKSLLATTFFLSTYLREEVKLSSKKLT